MQNISRDIRRSAEAFVTFVWPAIRDAVGGGEIVPVEAVSDEEFTRILDTLGGIDAWQLLDEQHIMRGIASRVQWIDPREQTPWNSFTIRYALPSGRPTEFAKRLTAVNNRSLWPVFPCLTVQAYLDSQTSSLLSVGIVRTEDLIRAAERYVETGRHLNTRHAYSGQKFLVIYWRHLIDDGVKVKVISRQMAEVA